MKRLVWSLLDNETFLTIFNCFPFILILPTLPTFHLYFSLFLSSFFLSFPSTFFFILLLLVPSFLFLLLISFPSSLPFCFLIFPSKFFCVLSTFSIPTIFHRLPSITSHSTVPSYFPFDCVNFQLPICLLQVHLFILRILSLLLFILLFFHVNPWFVTAFVHRSAVVYDITRGASCTQLRISL
jgi:hypothetical protein